MVALESVIFRLHLTEVQNIQKAIGPALIFLGQETLVGPDASMVVQTARVLSVYHVLFIVAQLFQLILLCDAVNVAKERKEKMHQDGHCRTLQDTAKHNWTPTGQTHGMERTKESSTSKDL